MSWTMGCGALFPSYKDARQAEIAIATRDSDRRRASWARRFGSGTLDEVRLLGF